MEQKSQKKSLGFYYTPRYTQDRYYLNIFRQNWYVYQMAHEGEIREYQFGEVGKFISCGDPKEGFVTDMDVLMPML